MTIWPVLLGLDNRLCGCVDTTVLVDCAWSCIWSCPFSVTSSLPCVTVEVESELGPIVDELEPVEETIDCDIESCSEEYESVCAGM